MTHSQKFSLAQEVTKTQNNLKIPNICPRCSQSASETTKILAHNFESSTGEIMMFGLLGQLLRFVAFGSESKTLLTTKICRSCRASWITFKILEWISRVCGVGLTVYLLMHLSTPEKPLAQQGVEMLLLTLSPLVIGAILAYVFRGRSDHAKGVTYLCTDGDEAQFRVDSADWLREFLHSNPEAIGTDGKRE